MLYAECRALSFRHILSDVLANLERILKGYKVYRGRGEGEQIHLSGNIYLRAWETPLTCTTRNLYDLTFHNTRRPTLCLFFSFFPFFTFSIAESAVHTSKNQMVTAVTATRVYHL